MKARKMMASLLAAVFSAALLVGCGGEAANSAGGASSDAAPAAAASSEATPAAGSDAAPATPATTDITFMCVDIYGTALSNDGSDEILQAAEDFTGINVDFDWVANDSYADVLGITLMDKENMPMVITITGDMTANVVQAAKDGAFWDLSPFITDAEKYPYLSQMNMDVAKNFTVDGQLVGIYRSRIIGRNGLGYRADWAEKLGIPEPKTFEDLYNMMYAFTYDDPDGNGVDDTYGLCLCKYAGPFDIMQAYYGAGNQWVEEGGKLVPVHQTTEYLEALKWFRKMYEEGLVYEDWATRETNTWQDGVKNGECGMYIDVLDGSRRIWDYFVNENIPAVTGEGVASMKLVGALAPTEGAEPRTLATSGSAGAFLITKSGAKTEADVEACLTYLDKMNANEMRILVDYGIEGRDHEIQVGHIVDLLKEMEVQNKPACGINQTVPYIPFVAEGLMTVEKSERLLEEEAVKNANETLAVFNPAMGLLVSSNVNAEVGTDLKDILDRARTQYICGQLDDAGLQAQFDAWSERGGNDLIAELNEMYAAN
jgi:putative aldouronate transport system substrate-binding protein